MTTTTTDAVAHFDWKRVPVKIHVNWGKAVYFWNEGERREEYHCIPLNILNDQETRIVAYILRRVLANHMWDVLTRHRIHHHHDLHASLPIRALEIKSHHHRYLEACRLLNWSVYILSRVVSPPKDSPFFYVRDQDVRLPGKSSNEDVIKRLVGLYSNHLATADDDDDGGNIARLFSLVSSKLLGIVGGGGKRKRSHRRGGMVTVLKRTETDVGLNFGDSSERVLEIMQENATDIVRIATSSSSYIGQVLRERDSNPLEPVYVNQNLSLCTLFHAVGEILTTFFDHIVPKRSMTDAMHASIFHLLYLMDLDLLDLFVHHVNQPVLRRLLFACFPTTSATTATLPPELQQELDGLPRLCGQGDLEAWMHNEEGRSISCLDNIVRTLTNAKDFPGYLLRQNDLYDVMNERRDNTLEYYLIVTLCYYTHALNSSLSSSAHDRDFNRRLAVKCLWKLTACFYHYIVNLPPELRSVQAITDFSFGNDPVYRRVVHQVTTEFLKQQQQHPETTSGK